LCGIGLTLFLTLAPTSDRPMWPTETSDDTSAGEEGAEQPECLFALFPTTPVALSSEPGNGGSSQEESHGTHEK
jgi:hypothetical protein